MATGPGKTLMAITAIYRTPDDNRKFTQLYRVQRLTSNSIGASSKVAITTVQRLCSMLRGEAEYDPTMCSTIEACD